MTQRLFETLFITGEPKSAKAALLAGVSRVFVDLEVRGKHERQSGRGTPIFGHTLEQLKEVSNVVGDRTKVMVRINPPWEGTAKETFDCIEANAGTIMLPYFTHPREVSAFVAAVGGRARTSLLLESCQSLARVEEILDVGGIDEVHIGFNDLTIDLRLSFLFEVLTGGLVDWLATLCRERGISFGFGGMGAVGDSTQPVPAGLVLSEHARLGSERVILSRAFSNVPESALSSEIAQIHSSFHEFSCLAPEELQRNRMELRRTVRAFIDQTPPR